MSSMIKILLLYVVLLPLLGFAASLGVRALLYSLTSKNYYFKHSERALQSGFTEKDLRLREGLRLHYVEGPAGGVPLLLIPGQGSIWQDYGPVLLPLSARYHIIAVDCHGHGQSSWNVEDYRANRIADDLVRLIEAVFGRPAVVSGHSSGGLIAACMAARHPDRVCGVVLEDPPFFTTEPARKENTYVWVDGFRNIRSFFEQAEEKDYVCYYMPRSYWRNIFGKLWDTMSERVIRQRRSNPSAVPYIPWAGVQINRIWESISHPYDLRFSVGFIDDTFFTGFDQEDTLSKVKCPSTFIKATTRFDKKRGLLLAALDEEDCNRVHALLPNNEVVHVKSGHDVHFERPKQYVKILEDFLHRM